MMLMDDLQRAFSTLVSSDLNVVDQRRVTGGCISEGCQVVTEDAQGQQQTWFAKTNRESFLINFQAEADGLTRLAAVEAIESPRPETFGVSGDQAWLIMKWIDQKPAGKNFFRDFGARLAEMHRCTSGTRIGLDRDNFLGAAKQINCSVDRWIDFVAENRLGVQLRWGIDQQWIDDSLRRDCERVIAGLDQWLDGRAESTSLLHGDLWSGNYLCDIEGRPVVIDPAVYYGCREAEFGMLMLFGACPATFYDSYQQVFPMPAGWQRRANVYVLYHLLNHLNLFGGGYHGQCQQMAEQILRT
jgi:fructosamine-3-kinase